jgi:mevalonate kinase
MTMIYAPGKLILSGEHSIVYGKPALAMAINRYVTATASSQLLPLISFDLSDLSYDHGLTLTALHRLKSRIKEKYQRFVRGDFKIRDVLQKPVELAQFAFSLFLETLNLKLTQGIKIRVQSTIPIGCGMGSSAATILSIVHAIADHLKVDISSELFFRLALEAENMQHGNSSGLDLRVSLNGGCIFVEEGEVFKRDLPSIPFYLINTGIPKSTTGECVSFAANYFKQSSIGDEFAAVTKKMDQALQANNLIQTQEAIRDNHKLLTAIGVVPQSVQQFVTELENMQGSAKICGAGTVDGEKAGVMLAVTHDLDALAKICLRYHYSILPVEGEARGVHAV